MRTRVASFETGSSMRTRDYTTTTITTATTTTATTTILLLVAWKGVNRARTIVGSTISLK
mgnify:FL=1